MTSLGNRRFVANALATRRTAEGGEIAALIAALDRFKQINDTQGHAAGDVLLSTIAEHLRAEIGSDDIVRTSRR